MMEETSGRATEEGSFSGQTDRQTDKHAIDVA